MPTAAATSVIMTKWRRNRRGEEKIKRKEIHINKRQQSTAESSHLIIGRREYTN